MAAATVSEALRRFLPDFLREHPVLTQAQRRAVFAIRQCRTAVMGGHLHACGACGTREFSYHSCNHRSCPLCGRGATFEWVGRELAKRVGAPYFMVTFTLPEELRTLFFTGAAKHVYRLFFASAAAALAGTLASPKWLGAAASGFTMILHTWNQRLQFHPHLHCIVPGAGRAANGKVVRVKNEHFLVPQPVLRAAFRRECREKLDALTASGINLPAVPACVWERDWGVHLQPFGSGERAIQYLGAYVSRTAIGDSRIAGLTEQSVSFRWKDRARGGVPRIETLPGIDFVRRYLQHVLPRGLKAIRYYGFCHPAAKAKRLKIAAATGCPPPAAPAEKPAAPPRPCPCCGEAMLRVQRLISPWRRAASSAGTSARSARPPPPPLEIHRA